MCLRETNLAAAYGADWQREKDTKERKAVRGTWSLYSKPDSRLAKLGYNPQDCPQFKNSWAGLRAVTDGYGLLQWKATVLNETRVEVHRTESRKVPLGTSSCLVPMKLWTELTFPGNNVWQYCQPGSSSEHGCSEFLLGLHQLELVAHPDGWPQSSAPLEAELLSRSPKPPPYPMGPQPPGKQRHSYQTFQWLRGHLPGAQGKKVRPLFG